MVVPAQGTWVLFPCLQNARWGLSCLRPGGAGGLQSHAVSCSWLLFSSRDDVIGKVCITRDMLAEHPKGRGMGGREGPSGHPSPTPVTSLSRGPPVTPPTMRVPPFPTGYSGWVSLSEVDPDEEVQGEIHLRVEALGSQGGRQLRCSVLEAR